MLYETSNAPSQASITQSISPDQAERRDKRTAKVIYQAQALRRAFGRQAAYTFLKAKRIPAELSMRMLSLPDGKLRR